MTLSPLVKVINYNQSDAPISIDAPCWMGLPEAIFSWFNRLS